MKAGHHRRYLLLLDNFEHLLPGATLVSEIIRRAAGVTVLTTSRERLNLKEESLFSIEGLPYPASPRAKDVLEYGAVSLFVDTAKRLWPGSMAQPANMAHIVRICQLLEGMPLGILLTAAWVNVLAPEEIEAEIASSLDLLQAVPRRHHSVRAAFKPSWPRLTQISRTCGRPGAIG